MPRSRNDSEENIRRKAAWKRAGMLLALVLCTIVVFGRVLQCEFLYWDDQQTISLNPSFNPDVSVDQISVYWDPDRPAGSLWIPITYTVWGITAALSPRSTGDPNGITLSPVMFHGLNLLIHCASVVLVFLILRRLRMNNVASFCAALFYALHPVMVEPVAWASGTKDVLSAAFCLAAIHAYVRFRDSELSWQESVMHYSLAVLCFILAMLSKPAAVTLPLILFVIDWLLLKRTIKQAATWALPLLILSLPVVWIGARAQPAEQTVNVPYAMRPFIAGDAIAFYLGKILWPVKLVMDYGRSPYWLKDQGWLMYATTAITLAVVAVGGLLRKRFPALLAAVGILIAATLPVLGLVSFEFEWFSTVSDHYLYLAMLGPTILVAVALERWRLPVVYAGVGVVLGLFSLRAVTQIGHWESTYAMHEHVIKVNPRSPAGYHAAGFMLAQQKRYDEAIEKYHQALAARPDFGVAHYSLALAIMNKGGDLSESLKHYEIAHKLLPRDAEVCLNMGVVLYKLGRYSDAETAFNQAVQLNPGLSGAYANLGALYLMSDRLQMADEALRRALDLNPNDRAAQVNLEKLDQLRTRRRLR